MLLTDYVIKRDGRKVKFDVNKIVRAIDSAAKEVRGDSLGENSSIIADSIADNNSLEELQVEQIQDLVDQLNEAVQAIHEANIEMRENIKDFQDKQYDAIVSKVEEYQQELQDEIDKLEDAYDDLITPLQEANDERERAIELEEKLQNLENAKKEKERVYREGIGWVKLYAHGGLYRLKARNS